MSEAPLDEAIRALHDEAVRAGRNHYRDPATGFRVFTARAHLRRGTCCGNGCRHCPYGHLRVPGGRSRADAPWWQLAGPAEADGLDLVSWSGGKDSWLAHRRLPPAGRRALLTTYDPSTGALPVQGVSLDGVRAQAAWLGLDLFAVPVASESAYVETVREALRVAERRAPIRRLAFGDLHLADVRAWRERTWADLPLAFPLWGASPDELLDELEASGVDVAVSASDGRVPVGARFDRAFVRSLPEGVDPFGENGEFHTFVLPGSR